MYETLRDRQTGKGKWKGAATAGGGAKKMVLNPYDRGDQFGECDLSFLIVSITVSLFIFPSAISPDGLLCQCREQRAWHGARATLGVCQGKHYYETVVTDEGLCRVGWSTDKATLELGE